MPLRIPLTAHHPDAPAPERRRRVHCPRCREPFDISRRAITIRCPRCAQPLAFDDLTLRRNVEGDVTTMGRVALAQTARMNGELICGSAIVAGHFSGDLTAYHRVTSLKGSTVRGTLTARSLDLRAGSIVTARVRIGPDPAPPPQLRPRRLDALTDTPRHPVSGLPIVRPGR